MRPCVSFPADKLASGSNADGKRRCAGCSKHAQYGPNETGRREVCAQHRRISDVDNVNPRCWFSNCGKRATYGVKGFTPHSCSRHKDPWMTRRAASLRAGRAVHNICRSVGCEKHATFGDPRTRQRTACKLHRTAHTRPVLPACAECSSESI